MPLIRSLHATHAIAALGAAICFAPSAGAADDPTIQGETRSGVQAAMARFIAAQQAGNDWLVHYDPVAGQLLRLRLVALHEGIVNKGHFFVSCADFEDAAGRRFDLDFLVVPDGADFRVNQAIVHKVDGDKRKYHVEQRWPGLF